MVELIMYTEVHRTIYTCYVPVVMCLQQSNSAVMEQICWHEWKPCQQALYRGPSDRPPQVWKYKRLMCFTGVQAQATGHCQFESMNARYNLLGTDYSV